jgi:hypothetical protein
MDEDGCAGCLAIIVKLILIALVAGLLSALGLPFWAAFVLLVFIW